MKQVLLFFFFISILTAPKVFCNGYDRPNDYVINVNPSPIRDRATVSCMYYIQKIEVFNLIGVIIGEYKGDETIDMTDQSKVYYKFKVYTPKGEFVKRVSKE